MTQTQDGRPLGGGASSSELAVASWHELVERNPPASGSSLDDEFAATGAIAAKWETFDPSSSLVLSTPKVDAWGLHLAMQAAANPRMAGVIQDAPAGDFSAYALVNTSSFNGGTHGIGVYVAGDLDGSPTTAPLAGAAIAGKVNDSEVYVVGANHSNYASGRAGFADSLATSGPTWLRVRYDQSAGDVWTDYSRDGRHWHELHTNSSFGTVNKVGILMSDTLAFLNIEAHARLFRVRTGTWDFYDLPPTSVLGD